MRREWLGGVALGAVLLMGAADGSWLKRVSAADRAKVNPMAGRPEAVAAGAQLYANECAKCHGERAQGRGSRPALVSERVAGATDGELAWMLRNGNPWKGMPSWSSLPDGERWQLVTYLRSINTPVAGGVSTVKGDEGVAK
jgi:mono/diheme cytochrome c family protein